MSKSSSPPAADAWALIETERRRDRFIRKVCLTAWALTFILVVVFAAFVGAGVFEMMKAARVGAVPWMSVVGAAMPFMAVLWTLCLLIATLSTVGVFLRMRTATLAEIQLRLAALEEMLVSRSETKNG